MPPRMHDCPAKESNDLTIFFYWTDLDVQLKIRLSNCVSLTSVDTVDHLSSNLLSARRMLFCFMQDCEYSLLPIAQYRTGMTENTNIKHRYKLTISYMSRESSMRTKSKLKIFIVFFLKFIVTPKFENFAKNFFTRFQCPASVHTACVLRSPSLVFTVCIKIKNAMGKELYMSFRIRILFR